MPHIIREINKGLRLGRVTADFATVASHQLRTPISIIRWSLDVLKSGRVGKVSSQQKIYLDQAYDQNIFMARIVNDLLKISRLESGVLSLHVESLDFIKVVQSVIKRYTPLFKAFNCKIQFKAKGNIPKIKTDKIKITEVIATLTDNAVRYSRGKNNIKIYIKKVKDYLQFKISDQGVGIPTQQQRLVFTKFFRGSDAIKLQTQGLGLQLYIAKHLVEALGGKIWFESHYLLGTSFYINIPLQYTKKPLVNYQEPALKFTNQILDYFYNSINDGLIIIDGFQRILRINQQAGIILGYSSRQVLGRKINKFLKNKELYFALQQAETGNKRKVTFLYKNVLGSDIYTYKVSVFPIIHYATHEGWLIIFHYPERKESSFYKESEILKREREMVSVTVHELKNPLSVTKWSLEMLQSGRAGKINIRQRELIDEICRGNERLLVLVSDLLHLSKIEEGKFEIKTRLCNLKNIIHDAIFESKETLHEKKLILKIPPFEKRNPRVLADGRRIHQVIFNLLNNAIKYSPPHHSITLGIKRVQKSYLSEIEKAMHTKIHFKDHANGYMLFWIKDKGIGIPRNQHKKIFTKFFRGKQILKGKIEGTGLGLYITKSIVHLHKGDIWFESKLNFGSTFYFTLPIA